MDTTIHGCRKIQDKSFLEKLVNERKYTILDVRSPVDYRDGTLLGATNAPLRNFTMEFMKARRETNKIIILGSKEDPSNIEVSIRYANTVPNPDSKSTNMSYVFYEEMIE